MRGLVGVMEKHHKVRVLDEAVVEAVKLSHRYIAGRQLPDKSVSVLDTACARLSLGQNTIPPAIEDATRNLEAVHTRHVNVHDHDIGTLTAAIEEVERRLSIVYRADHPDVRI